MSDSDNRPGGDPERDDPSKLTPEEDRGIVAWFTRNTVAANLLAIIIVLGGIAGMTLAKVEVFPELEPNVVTVQVAYPGATPEEVEEGICQRIEEAVSGITGVDRVTSSSTEGAGAVTVEGLAAADIQTLYNDIKTQVDGITSFPEEAEEPIIQRQTIRKQVINVAIYGDTGDPYS